MSDLRIKIDSSEMCQEAQELLIQLGKSWSCGGLNFSYPQKEVWLHTYATQIFWCHDSEISEYSDKQIVTIPQLRDMVVLKRNDVNDANYEIRHPQNGLEKYLKQGDKLYQFCSTSWVAVNIKRHNRENMLRPIQKPQSAPEQAPIQEEYLNTKTGELLLWDKGQPRSTNWIKVPEGADTAVQFDKIYFYNDEFEVFTENGWEKSGFKTTQQFVELHGKVIWQRNQQPIREYLDTKFHCLRYVADGTKRPDSFVLVPEGAECATYSNAAHGAHVLFWKKVYEKYLGTFDYVFDPKRVDNGWFRGGNNLKEYLESESYQGRIIWQRDPQPEPDLVPQLDASDLLNVVYHYSASINTPRGTMHYDGVITFPGRITGIEDYHQLRAEIAQDGNTTPDKVNVHSLNIVG